MTIDRSTVLIVEDQPFIGLVASDILREAGVTTLHASDAPDALEVLDSHPEVGVMMIEVDLGGPIGGLDLSRRVASERPDVQVIVTSGRAVGESEVPQGTRILHKPYASEELRAVVPA